MPLVILTIVVALALGYMAGASAGRGYMKQESQRLAKACGYGLTALMLATVADGLPSTGNYEEVDMVLRDLADGCRQTSSALLEPGETFEIR